MTKIKLFLFHKEEYYETTIEYILLYNKCFDVCFIGSVEQNGLTAEARLVRFGVCSKKEALIIMLR